ncbi:MAG: dTDP-glucose 4,6-dehydratase [Planctomycetota bacterium]|nr:dTDP-glucose 4,6-dehydratase [Planctomycetota bacterium]
MRIMVAGGAGFIGAHFVRWLLAAEPAATIVNFDALTYAADVEGLRELAAAPRHIFIRGDIADFRSVSEALARHACEGIINFAAESHVDRSIADAAPFLRTNTLGTQVLLEAARRHGVRRYCQISTDEVYGAQAPGDPPVTEAAPLCPSSPYAASKAAADLIVQSYRHTYGLDTVIVRPANNYGPRQFPEKFIPVCITRALRDLPVPIYGDGQQLRDWLHVADNCAGIWAAFCRGRSGEIYNLGARNERKNIDVARQILRRLGKPETLLALVADRPGHDRRYALNFAKAERELGWRPQREFEIGLAETVDWYVQNRTWWENILRRTAAEGGE